MRWRARAPPKERSSPSLLGHQIAEVARLTVEKRNALAGGQAASLRDRLRAQLDELLTGAPIAQDRLAQEVALIATRADVREELDPPERPRPGRARTLIAAGDAVGRKLPWISSPRNSTARANTLPVLRIHLDIVALTRVGLALESGDRPVPRAGAKHRMTDTIHRRGLMMVLSSPSGAGKTTLSRQAARGRQGYFFAFRLGDDARHPARRGSRHRLSLAIRN